MDPRLVYPHNPVESETTINVEDYFHDQDKFGMTFQGVNTKYAFGTDLYGPGANNPTSKINQKPVFSIIKSLNSNWGNFEYNPSNLTSPRTEADYATSYKSIRDSFNYGAHVLVPMAWQGKGFDEKDNPITDQYFQSFAAIRACPFEHAMVDFMAAYKDIPRGTFAWEFGSQNSISQDSWTLANHLNLTSSQSNGILKMNISGNDPFIVSPDYLTFNTNPSDTITVRTKVSGGDGQSHIYWTTESDPNFGGDKVLPFNIIGDGQFREYSIPVGTQSEWKNVIKQIRVDPTSGDQYINKNIEIDYIRINSQKGLCDSKLIGDADCNSAIDLNDFLVWKQEFKKERQTLDADFTGSNDTPDNKVGLTDFNLWRVNFRKMR